MKKLASEEKKLIAGGGLCMCFGNHIKPKPIEFREVSACINMCCENLPAHGWSFSDKGYNGKGDCGKNKGPVFRMLDPRNPTRGHSPTPSLVRKLDFGSPGQ